MLDSLSIVMQKYLYQDLYNLEETHWWHKAKRNLVCFFLKKYFFNKKNRLLDVGCGAGKNIEAFSKFGTVWGVDFSSEAISFCKKRGLKKVSKGNLEKLSFEKNTFDCVTALDVLEHVDDSKALNEIYRVLKKSGILIATVPAYPALWSKWDEVLHHKRRYAKNALSQVLEKAGFQIIKNSYSYSFLVLPILITRAIKKLLYRKHYPSDFLISNKILNSFLAKISEIEKFLIVHTSVPFGTSLIVVAKKN